MLVQVTEIVLGKREKAYDKTLQPTSSPLFVGKATSFLDATLLALS
jgi:hypothetical protein